MARIARICLNTSFYHVMVQGINKEYIFKKKRYINQYLKLIKEKINNNIEIIAFCIMSNHAHLLIKTEKILELSKFMQRINSSYAKYYNYMENERVGYVFRDRYKSESILDKRQLIQCVKYIHQNPVKAHMVKKAGEYPYSSYNLYLNRCEDEIFTKDEIELICNTLDYEETFIDIEDDTENIFYDNISKFLKKENIKLFELFEKSDILKKLIRYLKIEKRIKYTQIMQELDITKGTMERLKKEDDFFLRPQNHEGKEQKNNGKNY